jgi:hypothetical protein
VINHTPSISLPGLTALLNRLPEESKPEFVRGDIDFGTDTVMRELEAIRQSYLFKLKKSKNVMKLIYQHHDLDAWTPVEVGWEAECDDLNGLDIQSKDYRASLRAPCLAAFHIYHLPL